MLTGGVHEFRVYGLVHEVPKNTSLPQFQLFFSFPLHHSGSVSWKKLVEITGTLIPSPRNQVTWHRCIASSSECGTFLFQGICGTSQFEGKHLCPEREDILHMNVYSKRPLIFRNAVIFHNRDHYVPRCEHGLYTNIQSERFFCVGTE